MTMDDDLRLAEERTELALERTREAAERTLMAWIRTSLAMIGFGFGTFKLFELMVLPVAGAAKGSAVQWLTAALVAWGTLLLAGAIIEYAHTMKRWRSRSAVRAGWPLALVGATGMALFGIVALVHLLVSFR